MKTYPFNLPYYRTVITPYLYRGITVYGNVMGWGKITVNITVNKLPKIAPMQKAIIQSILATINNNHGKI
jgi:hypothetical protein